MKYSAELCEQAVLISFAFLFRDIQIKPDYIVLPLLPVFLSTLPKDQYNTLKGIPQAFLCSTLSRQWWIQERGPGDPPPVIFRPTWGPKGKKKKFLRPVAPPPLSQCLDDHPPPLSEGLDLPLPSDGQSKTYL